MTTPQKKTADKLLNEIQKFASWEGNREQEIHLATEELRASWPERLADVQARIEMGKEIRQRLKEINFAAAKQGSNGSKVVSLHREFCQKFPFLKDKADSQMAKGDAARQRRIQEKQLKKKDGKATTVTLHHGRSEQVATPQTMPRRQTAAPIPSVSWHPRDVRAQSPAPAWSLIIDETGDCFSDEAQTLSPHDRHLGRWVALLVPQGPNELPPLPRGWHAVSADLTEIDRVVQCVLNARVGILGLTVNQLPLSTGERWADGVLNLIDWVLRLLPLDGPSALHVQIENRDVFTNRMEWPALARDAMRRLALAYPERASLIDLDIHVIGKDGSPFNGYVDALAFTWGSPTEASRARLKATQLAGTCFLEGDTKQIRRAWEWLDRGITIRTHDWADLLAQRDAQTPGGLTSTILQRLGESCRNDQALWLSFVNEALLHLDSKAIRLKELGSQIDWLEVYRPDMAQIPPRLHLLWLTARLAHANHMGSVEQGWMNEIEHLGQSLLEEDAPLVCWTSLHLAVNATNRYDFALASRCLASWENASRSVPGLRYWAQVASSLGQHAAFLKDPAKALEHFTAAIVAFERLSDEAQRRKEISQTATYRALVEMDYANADQARSAIECVTGSLPAAIERLASSHQDGDKYQHHLVLRWLVFRGSETERQIYLSQRMHWSCGFGHPWPLIELYRGMLLAPTDKALAIEQANHAFILAMEGAHGPVVQLIGACSRAVALPWGFPWQEGTALLDEIEKQLPAAVEHIGHLRAYMIEPTGSPLELLQKVLPFNFH